MSTHSRPRAQPLRSSERVEATRLPAQLRQARLSESAPAEAWWHRERERVVAGDFLPEVGEMYRQSVSFAKFDREFRQFWQLPVDFAFAEE